MTDGKQLIAAAQSSSRCTRKELATMLGITDRQLRNIASGTSGMKKLIRQELERIAGGAK